MIIKADKCKITVDMVVYQVIMNPGLNEDGEKTVDINYALCYSLIDNAS